MQTRKLGDRAIQEARTVSTRACECVLKTSQFWAVKSTCGEDYLAGSGIVRKGQRKADERVSENK